MRVYRDDQKFLQFRINAVMWGIVAAFVFLAGSFWFVQGVQADKYRGLIERLGDGGLRQRNPGSPQPEAHGDEHDEDGVFTGSEPDLTRRAIAAIRSRCRSIGRPFRDATLPGEARYASTCVPIAWITRFCCASTAA